MDDERHDRVLEATSHFFPRSPPRRPANPTFLRLYARHLRPLGLSLPYEERRRLSEVAGDASVPGRERYSSWRAHSAGA